MERFQSLSANRLLFDLAARMGSLEGYLYAEEKVDPQYFPNWLQHIDDEFKLLAAAVGNEVRPDYLTRCCARSTTCCKRRTAARIPTRRKSPG